MTPLIRDYAPSDRKDLLALIKIAAHASYPDLNDAEFLTLLEKHLDFKLDRIRLLTLDKKVIGMYRYGSEPRGVIHRCIQHLFDIAIEPFHQRKGYGTMLFEDMKGCLKNDQCRVIYSRTTPSNAVSRDFHIKIGMTLLKESPTDLVFYMELQP